MPHSPQKKESINPVLNPDASLQSGWPWANYISSLNISSLTCVCVCMYIYYLTKRFILKIIVYPAAMLIFITGISWYVIIKSRNYASIIQKSGCFIDLFFLVSCCFAPSNCGYMPSPPTQLNAASLKEYSSVYIMLLYPTFCLLA